MNRNNGGFTLIEVLISIVVLGLVVLPVCSSLVMATRINAKAESILDAKLAVSSAVETLMASGLEDETPPSLDGVKITIDEVEHAPYYKVKVVSEADKDIFVETYIRQTPTEPAEEEGGGTD